MIAPDYRITMISGVFLSLFLCRRDEHSQVEKTCGCVAVEKHLCQGEPVTAIRPNVPTAIWRSHTNGTVVEHYAQLDCYGRYKRPAVRSSFQTRISGG